MLSLTEKATSVIRSFANYPWMGENAGLRIAGSGEPRVLQVSPEPQAPEGDQVVEVAGARVFLEPLAAVLLADKVVDVREDGGQVEFLLLRNHPTRSDRDG